MAPPAARCTWRPNPGRIAPAGVFYCPDPAAGGNEGGLTSGPDPSRPRTISSIPTSNPDPPGAGRLGSSPPRPAPTKGPRPRAPTPTRPTPTSGRVPLTPDHGRRQTDIGSRRRGPQQGRNLRPPTENKRNSRRLDGRTHLRGLFWWF